MTYSARTVVRKFVLTAGAAALVFGAGAFLGRVQAASDIYLKISGIDGEAKDARHMNWIACVSVVAADLDGDAMADREQGSGMATGKVRESPSQASTGQTALRESPTKQSTGQTTLRESPTKQSTGATALRESPTKSSTGVTSPRDVATGQASGKRMHKPFVITKEIDKSSPLLMRMMQSGMPIREMDVDLGRPTAQNPSGRYHFTDAMITSIRPSGGGDRPTESISFTYQKIEMK